MINYGNLCRVFAARFYVYSVDNIVGYLETDDVFIVVVSQSESSHVVIDEIQILTKLGVGLISRETLKSCSESIKSWMILHQKSGDRHFLSVNTKA